MKRNYSKELEKIIDKISKEGPKAPRLLLHSCCAPCSSYVMEYLREYFRITVFYYNPNITQNKEYQYRLSEEKRLIAEYNRQVEEQTFEGMHSSPEANRIEILDAPYDPQVFFDSVRGYEDCKEGGERCFRCYELRLRATAEMAGRMNTQRRTLSAKEKDPSLFPFFDYFSTTLTISPLKNATKLNEIGERLGEEYGVQFLPSDFKKKDGYKRSIELSHKFGLYRQDYCGCTFSRAQREREKAEKAAADLHQTPIKAHT